MEFITQRKCINIFIFVLFVLCTSCQNNTKDPVNEGYEKYERYVRQIEQAFAEQMKREFNLQCIGNRGRMHEKVEEMGMKFNAYRRATIEEARALQLLVMDRFVQAINAHEKIQPFLQERPFTFKSIEISIAFEGVNGRYADGSVDYIFNVSDAATATENKNTLFYSSEDPFTGRSVDLFKEPYEEAVRLNKASLVQNPAIHKTTEREEVMDHVLEAFTKEMEKEYGLQYWSIGGKISNGIEEFGAKFITVRRATQEQARKLELFVITRFLQAINTNEKLRSYLIEYPFPTHRLKIGIGFRKNNGYNYRDGSMESVTLEGDEITYFQEPPPDDVYPLEVPVFAKESYQEALIKE